MVKVELNYNPYLLETGVKFNGQEPRVNSLVEKYSDGPLQNWIFRIPKIFHDEMNGYDFELDFSGTKTDYMELQTAFDQAGVGRNHVYIFHKNELEDRDQKIRRIADLLTWLEQHPNRQFDNSKFRADYKELFDGDYPYIIVGCGELDTSELSPMHISTEEVESVEELANTDLTNTPILFYVSSSTVKKMSGDLKDILHRADVSSMQIFFLIANDLDGKVIERIIKDLGVSEPQIVSKIFGVKIKKYFEIYPITDFIYHSILALRNQTDHMQRILNEKNLESEENGKEIHEQLGILEADIQRLKDADDIIIQRDNLEMPAEFQEAANIFERSILGWKNKKTKITNSEEAVAAANEFNDDLHGYYKKDCTGCGSVNS